jgi:hypothetical protein
MPTVHVPVSFFNRLIQRTFSNEELETLCFNFGIEFEFEEKTEEAEVIFLGFYL